MRIYKYVLITLLSVCASGIGAQSLAAVEKAVGGLSMRGVQQKIALQTQLQGTVSERGPLVPVPVNLPPGTRIKGSLSGVINGYARLPWNTTQFTLPQLPQVQLTAVTIDNATFVRKERVFLPKGSYAVKMPDGDYRFFTNDVPASTQLTAQIDRARFGDMLQFDFEAQPERPVWNGPRSYTSQDELARDVSQQRQPIAHYSEYAFMGPIDVYEVPAGVVYSPEGHRAPMVLDPQGSYVLIVIQKTGRGQLIEKEALELLARP
ncbi:MAG: hypothetical protein IJ876_05925 [Elusimicrobiaceae bacterium]|nr:hypothetical protein [Elusimicrobiaceae bacterium]